MLKWISALVFTDFILIIYAHDPVVYELNERIINTKEKAEQYLAEIQTEEALPLILFEKPTSTSNGDPFDFPETIDTVLIFSSSTTVDGIPVEGNKMLTGTSFSTAFPSNEPMFFCPKQNSSETCLAPQEFRDNHRLVCPVQPIPTVGKRDEVPCGNHKNTHTYSMGYEICEEPSRPEKALAAVYYVCYDTVNQKILYTSHYILSPRLLNSFLLLRERQLKFPFKVQPLVPTANRTDILDLLLSWNIWEAGLSTTEPHYLVQMLAPSGDFALGSWIKTAYQYVNMELQHDSLHTIWNEVVDLVRRQAMVLYNDIQFYIRTGVFDLNAAGLLLPNDGQKYNMWVKLVISVKKGTEETLRGVVFMANNFITGDPEIQDKILDYCPSSFCDQDFSLRTGNKVLCCKANNTIGQLFGPGLIRPKLPMLEIEGLN